MVRRTSGVTRPVSTLAIGLLTLFVLSTLLACGGSGGGNESGDDATATETGTSTSSNGIPGAGGSNSNVPDTLVLGESYSFEMPEDTIEQRFSLVVPPGAIVTVEASAAQANSGSTGFSIGPTVGQLRRLEVLPGQSIEPFRYITSSDGGGTWTVEVRGRPGNRIDFNVTAPLQSDGGVEGDAGSNATVAKDVALGTSLNGLTGDEDSEDWYAIPLAGGEVVQVALDMLEDTGSGGVSADLLFNGQPLASASVFPGGEGSLTQIFAEDQAGTAQLRLFGHGSYKFAINARPQQDGGLEGDAGGDAASARAVDAGVIEGVVGGQDRHDYYRLTLPLAAVVTLEAGVAAVGSVQAEINVSYNGQPILIGGALLNPGQTESYTFVLNNEVDEELILQLSGSGRYSLDVDAFTQTDGGQGLGDAPGTEDLAMEIPPEESLTGYLNNGRNFDGRDWYRFTATTTGPLTIVLNVDPEVGANVNVRIREMGGRQLGQLNAGRGGSNSATVDVEEGMQYTLHVSTGQQAKYTLSFE